MPPRRGRSNVFFRRVRDQFLIRQLDLSSLTALNRQFTDWVESDYNAVEHDAIGLKPIDRFGMDLSRVHFLSPSEHNDELFYAEATRKVKKDNTFSFQKPAFMKLPSISAIRQSRSATTDTKTMMRPS